MDGTLGLSGSQRSKGVWDGCLARELARNGKSVQKSAIYFLNKAFFEGLKICITDLASDFGQLIGRSII
jgi:hypothetical protein